MKNLRTLNILRNVTWGGGNFKDKSTAYTLAEVIVVLLVVAIIVSISIKATKNKLNRITPIAYYSAVSTVRSVTEEMLKDFQTNDDYLSKGFNLFPPAFAIQDIGTSSFANNYYQQFYCPVYMDTYPTVSYIYELNGYKFNPTKIPVENVERYVAVDNHTFMDEKSIVQNVFFPVCGKPPHYKEDETYIKCPGKYNPFDEYGNDTTYETFDKNSPYVFGGACTQPCKPLKIGDSWDTIGNCGYYSDAHIKAACLPIEFYEKAKDISNSIDLDVLANSYSFSTQGNTTQINIAPSYYYWKHDATLDDYHKNFTYRNYSTASFFTTEVKERLARVQWQPYNYNFTMGDYRDYYLCGYHKETCSGHQPCGKECDESTGQWVDKVGFSKTCSDGSIWDDDVCGCKAVTKTIPRSGANYCKLFVNYANTSASLITGGEECNGSAIEDGTTDFSEKVEDIALRNGIRIYNASQDPVKIDVLNNNSEGRTYVRKDGTEIDIDEWGYVLYIDIDNKNNNGNQLWEDVFPFYVTLSGKVIPAFDMYSPEEYGGDSRNFLQTTVQDEFINAQGRQIEWVTKSKSFKESACKMGYIKQDTPYCVAEPTVTTAEQCLNSEHDCRLKYIMPVKFF